MSFNSNKEVFRWLVQRGEMKNLYSLLIKKNGGRQVRFPLAEAAVRHVCCSALVRESSQEGPVKCGGSRVGRGRS